MKRLNKFLHAAKLESWIDDYHPAIFGEWELSGLVEWIDFWDWLDREYPEILAMFKDWFRRVEAEKQEESC